MTGKLRAAAAPRTTGFTLVELVVIIVILGLLAAVAIPQLTLVGESARDAATRSEMNELRRAMIGSPAAVVAGRFIHAGYEGDVGFLPGRLEDLVVRPDTVPPYDRLTRLGWNGPYVDSTGGSFRTDAWGAPYRYDPLTRRLCSVGGKDTIEVVL